MSDWITTRAAIELSGYSLQYLQRLVRTGKVKAQKWGRDWQVSRASLVAYIHEAKQATDKRRGPKS